MAGSCARTHTFEALGPSLPVAILGQPDGLREQGRDGGKTRRHCSRGGGVSPHPPFLGPHVIGQG